ncbi:MAG: FKBP-type peptidyl-prolyl cis-trans isomerase [Verrucomicrobiota bacterium JB022]|nr:FKBP-type peptidyl-prolyl cis-trans isomerase [Verrucomicrobiota bacterium JB022]
MCQLGAQAGASDPHAGHDHAGHDHAGHDHAAAAAPAVDVSDEEALNTMGRLMAQQLRLNIGFTDSELQQIFDGMRATANDEPMPEDFQPQLQKAQQIYMSKMEAFQAKEEAKAAEQAKANKEAGAAYLTKLDAENNVQKAESGLRYEIIELGEGKQPTGSDRVTVNYTGTLIDGTEFDSGEGVQFPLNGVVPGFSEGIQLIKEGGKARLYIPSDLAYGDAPARPGSPIEPGSTLIFDVELVSVAEAPAARARPATGGRPTGTPPSPPPNYTPPPPPSEPPPPPPSGSSTHPASR